EDHGIDRQSLALIDDKLVIGGSDEIAALPSRDHFVVEYGGGFLVRDAAGCAYVTEGGHLEPAPCQGDRDGRTAQLPGWSDEPFHLAPGLIVRGRAYQNPFRQVRSKP